MMKRILKKVGVGLLSFGLFLSSVVPVYADQVQETIAESEIKRVTEASKGKGVLDISIIYQDNEMYTNGDSYTISYNSNGKTGTLDVSETDENEGSVNIELDPGEYKITDLIYNGSNKDVNDYASSSSFKIEEGKTTMAMVLVGSELIDYYLAENADPLFIPGQQTGETSLPNEEESDVASSKQTNTPTIAETETDKNDQSKANNELEETEKHSFWDYPFTQLIPLAIMFGVIFVTVFLLHKKGKF